MMRYIELRAPFFISFVLLCATGGAGPSSASEFELHPSLALSEEFNDNIFNTASDRRSDFVTRIRPGVALLYRTPDLSADLSYNFEYRDYARDSRGKEQTHTLVLHSGAELFENFLFVELTDTLSRVSLDVARDVTSESLFVNQTDQNRAVFSPYLLWRLSEKSALKTGYRYTDTRYWGVDGGEGGINRQEHTVFADLSHEYSSRLTLSAGYALSHVDTDIVDYDHQDISAGASYQYAENSLIFGGIGNSWQRYSDSHSVSDPFWNAGIKNDFGLLVATAETKVAYIDDPLTVSTKETSYRVALEKPLQHGSAGLSGTYSKYAATRVGESGRRKTALDGFWRYDLSPRLAATVVATGDKLNRDGVVDDYPYHFSGSAGVSYGFNYDISTTLTYTYVEYRHKWDSSADAKQTNRVVLEARKVF